METQLTRKIRETLTAQDGAAFVDRTKDYAPRSGEDYRPGFILLPNRNGDVSVASALPSGYQDRSTHMEAYASALDEAGFNVATTWKGSRLAALKVTP